MSGKLSSSYDFFSGSLQWVRRSRLCASVVSAEHRLVVYVTDPPHPTGTPSVEGIFPDNVTFGG